MSPPQPAIRTSIQFGQLWNGSERMEPRKNGTRFEYRPQIDGLRAIAVVFVVLFHCNVTIASGGYIGVDVFFVLSGFVISSMLLRELENTGSLSFLSFYSRRTRRLLPESVVTLILSALFVYFCFNAREANHYFEPLRDAALYIENWGLLANREDYWNQPQYPSPVLHYWSLSAEEQFYMAFPVLLYVIFHFVGKDMDNLLPVWGFITIGSAYLTGTVEDDSVRHLNTLCRVYQLGAGIVVALYVWKSSAVTARAAAEEVILDQEDGVSVEMQTFPCDTVVDEVASEEETLTDSAIADSTLADPPTAIATSNLPVLELYKYTLLPVGIVIILATGTDVLSFITGESTSSKYCSLFSAFGCVLSLAGIEEARKADSAVGCVTNKIMWFLQWRPMVYVGEVSYAVYLVHWPIIVFTIKQLKMVQFLHLKETHFLPSLFRVAVVLGMSMIVATIYRYAIYRPVVKHVTLKDVKQRIGMVIGAVLIPIFLVAFFYALFYLPAPCIGYFDGALVFRPALDFDLENEQVEDMLEYVYGSLPDSSISHESPSSTEEDSEELKPPIQDRDWYLDVDLTKYVNHRIYPYKASSPDRPRVLIVGDSHSLMFNIAAKRLAEEEDLNMIHEASEGCIPLYSSKGDCDYHIAKIIQLAKRFKPDLVVMFSLFSLDKTSEITIREKGVMRTFKRNEARYWDVVEDAFARVLEEISPHAGVVSVVQSEPLPTLRDDRVSIPDCVCEYSADKDLLDSGFCDSLEIIHIPEMTEVSNLIENSLLRNNLYITMDDIICPNGRCPAIFDGDRVTYADENGHISQFYWESKRGEVWERLAEPLHDSNASSWVF